MEKIRQFCVQQSATVRRCMEVINATKIGIALVVNKAGRLVGTVTDGDIRRFLLSGNTMEEKISRVMWTHPVTAPLESPETDLKRLMKAHSIKQLPLVDAGGRPKRIVTLKDLVLDGDDKCVAVIMAGGEGQRLRPITKNIPKPMVKVGGEPILGTIVRRLVAAGIKKLYISLNYKGHVIEDHFQDGARFGAEIAYLRENKKLGTAGALSLMPEVPPVPVLTVNGDILTQVDYSAFLSFHEERRCVMTVGSVEYRFHIPYGVLNLAGHYLLGIEEKPEQKVMCNAGIYLINPELMTIIRRDVVFNMTDLILEAIRRGLPVATFPIFEYWVDVGQREDLKRARAEKRGAR
jgi:dTDP-glucose pyrophosphorylase